MPARVDAVVLRPASHVKHLLYYEPHYIPTCSMGTCSGWIFLECRKTLNGVPSAKVLFGRQVRALRMARRLSQEKLAELCDFKRNYVNPVETARTDPQLASILKRAAC